MFVHGRKMLDASCLLFPLLGVHSPTKATVWSWVFLQDSFAACAPATARDESGGPWLTQPVSPTVARHDPAVCEDIDGGDAQDLPPAPA